MKLIIGILTAVLFSGILILSIENGCSLRQVLFGFAVFVFQIIFVSEIKNNSRIFVALVFSILFAYLNIKWVYYSTFIGVLLAIIVGFPIHYFVVRKTKIE
jgi:hypothetical protein